MNTQQFYSNELESPTPYTDAIKVSFNYLLLLIFNLRFNLRYLKMLEKNLFFQNLEKETNWARTYQKTIERLYGLESNRETEADL